jgi:allophanate hydrolase
MDKRLPAGCLGDIETLIKRYASGELTPSQVVETVHAQIENNDNRAWITIIPLRVLKQYACAVEARAVEMDALPLYGVPFAIKDNIDLAGFPTTAACPAYAYTPQKNATVVQKLIDAGAIPIGKTNLDQFATGLNGTRSPYGACQNAFDPNYISGGSSSGSAVALAKGMVCFSLGTDTAGSGRVPAAFNNLIGYKPTRGWLSTSGVVPACRSLDCVSIFAFTAKDADRVLEVSAGYDEEDIYSRRRQEHVVDFNVRDHLFRFGVPRQHQLQFFGNEDAAELFDRAVARMEALGGSSVEIDFAPFLETARLLYEGPWVAERYAAIKDFFELHSDQVVAPVRGIIEGSRRYSAADAYNGVYELRRLKRETERIWTEAEIDCLLTPTAGTIYTIQEMQQDPLRLNANLGYYTNFVNLLDYAAVAVPSGFQKDGLPFGVTLVAQAHRDIPLLYLAKRLHQTDVLPLGATGITMQNALAPEGPLLNGLSQSRCGSGRQSGWVRVAVCGAHLSGLPLNGELTGRSGRLVASTRTSSDYKLFALPGGPPHRPGLVRVEVNEPGTAIEVEVWEMPVSEFGSFVACVPVPLGIGTITLASGEAVQGFLCEQYAIAHAVDISRYGGWRAYLKAVGGELIEFGHDAGTRPTRVQEK